MGSGALKTLLSDKISHDQFLYLFSCGSHSSEPCIGLLLRGLSVSSCRYYWFLVADASVIDHCFTPLSRSWGPVSSSIIWSVPRVLGAVAAQMSLLVTGITLNFA